MRLLFLIGSPEYLRYFDSTLELLADHGHDVALAVNSRRERKPVGLERLGTLDPRVRILGVAPAPAGVWSDVGRGLRGVMDFARYLDSRFADSPALRARMKRKALPHAFAWLDRLSSTSPDVSRRIIRLLSRLEWAVPIDTQITRFLSDAAPDALIVSPLVDAASRQVDYVKAARALGIPTAVCVASWDNLTNKGLLKVEPDRVIVWNEAQRREAIEYHGIDGTKVVVTGAQVFDRWFTTKPTRARAEFCARVGLRSDGPFVLFTGSSTFVADSTTEVAFVRRWAEALRRSHDLALRDANVLMRPHPYNRDAWRQDSGSDLGFATFPTGPTGRHSSIDPNERADFYDSIFHAAAVVGINTSAMLEAVIIGRPVLSLHTPEFAETQEGTLHFHHLLPEKGGFLRFASTLDEHTVQLSELLRSPQAVRADGQRFVAQFIRPCGLDRPAAPIVAGAIEDVAMLGPRPVPRPSPWVPIGRLILLLFGAYAGAWNWSRRRYRDLRFRMRLRIRMRAMMQHAKR